MERVIAIADFLMYNNITFGVRKFTFSIRRLFNYKLLPQNPVNRIEINCCTRAFSITMASRHFSGKNDRYGGVIVDSTEEPYGVEEFKQCLEESINQWKKIGRNTIWFYVHLPQTEWVPILVKSGFVYHHAREQCVILYKKLNPTLCNIPPYAHTNLGVGGFVYNQETNEILTVKEKSRQFHWKLPGGFMEKGENIEDATKREILEETGIETDFKCIIGFRHGHGYNFDCSDIYYLSLLTPKTLKINKCDKEIAECKWMNLNDYVEHPEVHENNKAFAQKMKAFLQENVGMTVEYAIHPITKKPICVYSINKTDIVSNIVHKSN